MTEMDNFSKKGISNKMKRLFEIASDHDATLKQVLERLDKQEYAMRNFWKIKTEITCHHTDQVEKQERNLNEYKEKKVTLSN